MEKDSLNKKPVSKAANKEFVKNTIELNPKLQEAKSKTAVISWGRMNPPTIGHEKLANKVAATAKSNNATPIIYLSHSQDAKKNPLSYEDKYMFARTAFGSMIQKSNAKTIIQVMQELQNKFTDVILVVGADRIAEFETLLNKYNGKDFKLDSIKVVSAGDRDPDAEGVEGMSASKMRAAAAKGDADAFKSGLPKKLQKLGQEVYDMVRAGMKIAEELEAEGLLSEAVLNLSQRRKRALIMRKYKTKIAAARNRAKRRMASTDKLTTRARKAAIRAVRKKIAGSKGADYANLSPSEKMMIDKRVAKRQKAIDRIARKLLPTVRKAEIARLRSQNTSKNEAFEAAFGVEQKEYKRYHQLFNGDKTVKHDRRFKFYKQKNVVVEDADVLDLIEQLANDIYSSIQLDETKIKNALFTKADKSGMSLSEIQEAYTTGVDSWNDTSTFDTPSQQGFANVSAVIAEKKYKEERTTTAQDPDVKDMEGSQPKKYFKDVAKSTKDARARHFSKYGKKADNDQSAYKPAPGDKGAKTKESEHTKKYKQMYGEELEISESADASLKKKADKTGMPLGVLRQVYNRGVAAWKTGHRPGTTPQQWGHARVNSFVTKSSGTWGKADADLAAKVRKEETEVYEGASAEDKMYAHALKSLMSVLERKKKESKGKGVAHSISYYANQVARGYSNMNAKKLQNMVPSDYAFEEYGAGEQGTDKLAKKYKKDTPGQDINEAFEDMLNEENQCALITQSDIRELEKFADNLLKDYGIDVEFTKHFGDRMSDDRNTPCINVKELKDFFRKIYANKGMKIKGNRGIEAILKDMQRSLNMPVVIDYKNGEVELTFKTIMRKKNFTSPNKSITY